MPTYRITYKDDKTEDVEAELYSVKDGDYVFTRMEPTGPGSKRQVQVLRVKAETVARVDEAS